MKVERSACARRRAGVSGGDEHFTIRAADRRARNVGTPAARVSRSRGIRLGAMNYFFLR